MKRETPKIDFWTMLAVLNVLSMIYPIHLRLSASSVDENLFATCVLIGSLLILVVVNAVTIAVATAHGPGRR